MVRRAIQLWVVAIAVVVGCLAFAATSGAMGGKPKTKVSFDLQQVGEDSGVPIYSFKVAIKPKKCKKNRSVTVFHDENGNGKFD